MSDTNLILQSEQYPQVSIGRVLTKAIKNHRELVSFDLVGAHDINKFIKSVLKEVQLGLNWVLVQYQITQLSESINNQFEDMNFFSTLVVGGSSRGDCGVHLSQTRAEEFGKIAEIHHVLCNNSDQFLRSDLNLREDVMD